MSDLEPVQEVESLMKLPSLYEILEKTKGLPDGKPEQVVLS